MSEVRMVSCIDVCLFYTKKQNSQVPVTPPRKTRTREIRISEIRIWTDLITFDFHKSYFNRTTRFSKNEEIIKTVKTLYLWAAFSV